MLEMLQDHSHMKVIQMRPVVLQYVDRIADTSGQACDQCDQSTDTFAKNLEENSSGSDDSLGMDGSGKVARDSIKAPKNISEVSEMRAHRSQRSHSNSDGNGLLKCYYCEKAGNLFETYDEMEYFKHGSRKHYNKPMFPNMVAIEKHNLKPQGKEWES